MATEHRTVVIVGPTASGKSELALLIAERYGGEIVCADSRTVYRGMDIGTAKPSTADQRRVPHHLLDVVNPDTRFTAADFQRLARQAINDIHGRNKIPFVVGGTGLYIDGLILDYKFDDTYNEVLRNELTSKSVNELTTMLKEQHIMLPQNALNKRHLIRALEKNNSVTDKKTTPDSNIFVAGIATDKIILEKRIRNRAENMFKSDIVNEARNLSEKYGWDLESMKGNIYPIARKVIDDEVNIKVATELFITRDRQLAKRQLTWFKRHRFINWGDSEHVTANISAWLDYQQ